METCGMISFLINYLQLPEFYPNVEFWSEYQYQSQTLIQVK